MMLFFVSFFYLLLAVVQNCLLCYVRSCRQLLGPFVNAVFQISWLLLLFAFFVYDWETTDHSGFEIIFTIRESNSKRKALKSKHLVN